MRKRFARNGISTLKSNECRATVSMASRSWAVDQQEASTTAQPMSAFSGATTSCWGYPSDATKRVRRLSWRETTSASAASKDSTSSRPLNRNAYGML
nr:hypothetical protein CPGR_00654 [Mycolicibacterium malmesburyense]